MVGRSYTFSRIGMFCNPIDVEVDIKKGLPKILISGLLSQEVKESRERIIPAIVNSGFDFPSKRVTINLAPAETIKTGTHFDLASYLTPFQTGEMPGESRDRCRSAARQCLELSTGRRHSGCDTQLLALPVQPAGAWCCVCIPTSQRFWQTRHQRQR